MYIPHPSLFFGRFNSFETHPNDIDVWLLPEDPNAVLAQDYWQVSTQANQPLALVTTVTFVEEQYYQLVAQVATGQASAIKGINIHVTQAGATLNPPSPHTPGVPAQGESEMYPAYDPTPILP
jgi:hypothetical protein